MAEFLTPTDIGNRAAQHCGAEMMDASLGFTEVSKVARQIGFVYGKLRRSELQSRIWTFATRRAVLRAIDATFMLLAPAVWSGSTTYFNGSIVADSSGTFWISSQPDNLNNQPGGSPFWELYCGPLAVPPWDTSGTTSYYPGDVVYVAGVSGAYSVYLSLIGSNADNPATASAYDPTVTYAKDAIVTFSSVAYQSLIDLNLNNEPDLAPALWAIGTTYAAGAKVGGSDGLIYQSIGSGNVGHNPTTDGGVHWTNTGVLNPWTTVISRGTGSTNWLLLGCALSELIMVYPIGAGPCTQPSTLNIFRLPANYLRRAPQNPKTPYTAVGGPTGVGYDDWEFEGDFLVTGDTGPIILRFIADFTDVTRMHDMFCEGLAARVAVAVAEPLTQSSAKVATIERDYDRFMGAARAANAIEDEYSDPPDDDYISVRQ
jgi:hypothetical protein